MQHNRKLAREGHLLLTHAGARIEARTSGAPSRSPAFAGAGSGYRPYGLARRPADRRYRWGCDACGLWSSCRRSPGPAFGWPENRLRPWDRRFPWSWRSGSS